MFISPLQQQFFEIDRQNQENNNKGSFSRKVKILTKPSLEQQQKNQ